MKHIQRMKILFASYLSLYQDTQNHQRQEPGLFSFGLLVQGFPKDQGRRLDDFAVASVAPMATS